MNGFSRLAFVETKLFLRETGAAIGVFGLPVALVIGFGLIPGFGDPQKGLSGQIGTEYIASISVAIVLAVLGLTGVPSASAALMSRSMDNFMAAEFGSPLILPENAARGQAGSRAHRRPRPRANENSSARAKKRRALVRRATLIV